ncbi:MAG: galactosyltransferase-related protein [Alphaproteobacteria bacterium]|nr:galactosyltransferase-related protein [Alphaproteobacteria bacterium]
MQKFSLIVTCKGRLMHLRQTLPLFCQLSDTEVTVVDYGCPDRSGDWVAANFSQVRVVSVDDDAGFNPSRARNIAARDSAADYLLFVDADIKVQPGAMDDINAVITPDTFATIDATDLGDDLRGTCIVPRAKFEAVGGYDELLKNYGMEDTELYARLLDFGCTVEFIPPTAFASIPHGDDLRTTFFPVKSIRKLRLIAQFYQEYAGVFRRSVNVPQLELEDREQIHAAASSLVEQLTAASDPRPGAKIGLKLPVARPDGKVGGDMEWLFELTMTMKPKDPLAFRQKYQNPLLYRK